MSSRFALTVTSSARPGRALLGATMAAGLLVLAACGGSSSYGGSGGSSSGTAKPAAAGSGAVKVASTGLGKVLETSAGRVVYLLTSDPSGTSTCSGSCLRLWPPVLVTGTPEAAGISATLGTLSRPEGRQLTVAGHPAYTYAGDSAAGQTSGQGITSFGGTWWALSPAGDAVTRSGPGGSTGSTSGGVRGY